MDDQVVMNFKDYRSSLSREKTEILEDVESGTLTTQVRNFVYWLRSSNADDELFGYILLVSALRREHKSISKFLIKKGCSVRLPQKTGHFCTPLYYAAKIHDWRITSELWKKGASPFDCDANIDTALELAMNLGDRWLIEITLDNILSSKESTRWDSACEDHILLFHAACWVKHPEAVRTFLSRGFSMKSRSKFNTQDWKGFTPLHFATCGYPERPYYSLYQDREKMISMLFEHDDTDVFAEDKQGRTPFHVSFKGIFQFDRHFILKHESQFKDRSCVNPEDGNGSGIFLMTCCLMTAYEEDAKKLRNLIEYLIENKVDLNCSVPVEDERYPGWTALHFATRGSFWTLMKLLLKHGADASILDESGDGPLNVLCRKSMYHSKEEEFQQRLELIQLLLENGADPNARICQDRTAIHELFRAYRLGRSPIYLLHESEMLLLSKNRNGINHTDRFGISYLHVACLGDDLGMIKTLVKNGASVNSQIESNAVWYPGYSPLHFAVESSRFEFVEYLVSQGADINAVNKVADTPLHLACDNFRAAKHNRKYELLDANDDYEWQPSRSHHIKIIEYLIQHGALIDAKNSSGRTPLLRNFFGPSSVLRSSYYGDQNEKFNESIKNELFIRQQRVMDILLNHGADINACCVKQCCEFGGTILHILSGHYGTYPLNEKLAELVLERGANVNAVDDRGFTPLHAAIDESISRDPYPSMIALLIKYGTNIHAMFRNHGIPLRIAFSYCSSRSSLETIIAKLLNLPNVDVNAQDIRKQMFLHIFIDQRYCFGTIKLLEAGADINVEDMDGNPPTYELSESLKVSTPSDQGILLLVVIIIHMKKLEKLNSFISEKVVRDRNILSNYLMEKSEHSMDSDIDEEVNHSKSEDVDDDTSSYHSDFKDLSKMAGHALETYLEEVIESMHGKSELTDLKNIIKRMCKKGIKRRILLELAKQMLDLVTKKVYGCPDLCSAEILNKDCNNHSEDSQKTSTHDETRKRSKNFPETRKSSKKSRRDH